MKIEIIIVVKVVMKEKSHIRKFFNNEILYIFDRNNK